MSFKQLMTVFFGLLLAMLVVGTIVSPSAAALASAWEAIGEVLCGAVAVFALLVIFERHSLIAVIKAIKGDGE